MFKRIITMLLTLLMLISCCSCSDGVKDEAQVDNSTTEVNDDVTQNDDPTIGNDDSSEKTPEELTEDFVRAVYMGDLDAFFAHIPEFTYDVLLQSEDIVYNEGDNKGEAVYNYFKSIMEEEPEDSATEVILETKISDTLDKDSYLELLREYYLPEGFITEDDLEKIEDVVYVAFNSNVKYANGEEISLTDFKAALPCVKIDGKWYVDYFYLVMIPTEMTSQS